MTSRITPLWDLFRTSDDPDVCWIWQGSVHPKGYGLYFAHGTRPYAHRAVYESVHGKLPAGVKLYHTCGQPLCVNPAHLFEGKNGAHWKGNAHGNARKRSTDLGG